MQEHLFYLNNIFMVNWYLNSTTTKTKYFI